MPPATAAETAVSHPSQCGILRSSCWATPDGPSGWCVVSAGGKPPSQATGLDDHPGGLHPVPPEQSYVQAGHDNIAVATGHDAHPVHQPVPAWPWAAARLSRRDLLRNDPGRSGAGIVLSG